MEFPTGKNRCQPLVAITHPKWANFHRPCNFAHTWENNFPVATRNGKGI